MTPGPSLQELIVTARAEAASDDPLDGLAAASKVASELEEAADAVLTHFVDQARRNGRSWSEISGALGVTKQAAHKRFSFATPTTLERFTERARSALRASGEAAASLGHGYIGTEHLLLGLFEPAGGIAARVLDDAGITREQVEAEIVAAVPRSPITVSDPPFTPRATRSIERAVAEALDLGHNYVGTEHLLLALFGDPEGLAAKILAALGAQREAFKDQIVELLSGFTKSAR
ncbi:MAG: Clp protease N-terminal domain-containing protein [Acidimicrobiia bacterium]